jgi:hypothetical protein
MEMRAKRELYLKELDSGKARPRVSRLTKKLIKALAILVRLEQEPEPGTETVVLEPGTVLGDIFGARR